MWIAIAILGIVVFGLMGGLVAMASAERYMDDEEGGL